MFSYALKCPVSISDLIFFVAVRVLKLQRFLSTHPFFTCCGGAYVYDKLIWRFTFQFVVQRDQFTFSYIYITSCITRNRITVNEHQHPCIFYKKQHISYHNFAVKDANFLITSTPPTSF